MYPEAVDGLPDTQQPPPDGQLLPLQPRKIQHKAVPRMKCHCSVLGVLLPQAGAVAEDRAVGAARLPCARLRGQHGKWLGTTSEISYLFACLYFYLFPPPSRSLELS